MQAKLLIDSIVAQTTVLIAQLSTAAGIRAPLSHVADQVFLDLAREIERQGVSRKVVADMFGIALRTYQKRMQRLTESASERHQTLWQAVYDFISEQEAVSRKRLDARFRNDSSDDVAAVLNDLVASRLVFASGRNKDALYRLVTAAERKAGESEESIEGLATLVWLAVFRGRARSLSALRDAINTEEDALQQAVASLVADGRLRRSGSTEEPTLEATTFLVPLGAEAGWEAAVFDHFSCVARAIANKVSRPRSTQDDVIGGATLSFEVHPEHPMQAEVYGLLARVRTDANELWNRVVAHNRSHPAPAEHKTTVSFYFGQNVERLDNSGEQGS